MGEAKDVRLKTNPKGGVLKDMLYQKKNEKGRYVGGHYVELRPGTVFLCDAEKGARLLGIRPEIVFETTELTDDEKAKKVKEDEMTTALVNADLRKKAQEIVRKREEAIATLEAKLRKLNPQGLTKEAEARGMKVEGNDPEAVLQAILDDERKKMEAAPAA